MEEKTIEELLQENADLKAQVEELEKKVEGQKKYAKGLKNKLDAIESSPARSVAVQH